MIDPKGSNPAILQNSVYDRWLAKVMGGGPKNTSKTKSNGTDSQQDAAANGFDE
jgi:hypothetical protein